MSEFSSNDNLRWIDTISEEEMADRCGFKNVEEMREFIKDAPNRWQRAFDRISSTTQYKAIMAKYDRKIKDE